MSLYRNVLKRINKYKDNARKHELNQVQENSKLNTIHISTKVTNTKRLNDPSPYLYVENIWSDQDYKQILAKLPQNDRAFNFWWDVPVDAEKGRNGDYRKRLDLPLEQAATRLDTEDGRFWHQVNQGLTNPKFAKTLLKPFEDIILERFGMTVDDVRFDERLGVDVFLMRHEPGYFLGPHTDRADRIATLIFYLPENDNNPELGTSLFLPKEKGFVDTEETRKHYVFDKFTTVYTAPYVRNSAFFFPQTNYGFHGVLPIDKSKYNSTRYGMQIQFFDKTTRKR